jgi:hypothetical protein
MIRLLAVVNLAGPLSIIQGCEIVGHGLEYMRQEYTQG